MKSFKSFFIYLAAVVVLVGLGKFAAGSKHAAPTVYSTCDEPPSEPGGGD